jgi:hypothetical protein
MHTLSLDSSQFPFISIPSSPSLSAPSSWSPPPLSFIKLNFDGPSKGNLSIDGFGGVFRSDNERILSNNPTKLIALEEGLKMDLKKHFTKLVVDGNSQLIIHSTGSPLSKISTSWRLKSSLERISILITQNLVLIPAHV